MTVDQFWEIIDQCSPHSFDISLKCRSLEERIAKLTPKDVRSFADHYWSLWRRAYHWPLWDAAAISHGGCGDDSFMDYRSTLITFGRFTFESAMANPDSLGDLDQPIPRTQEVDVMIHSVVERVLGVDYCPPVSGHTEATGESIEDEGGYESVAEIESLARIRFPRLYEQQDRMSKLSLKKPWWKLW